MAYRPYQNRFTSPIRNNQFYPYDEEFFEGSSNNYQDNNRRPRSLKKKNVRRSPVRSPPYEKPRSLSRGRFVRNLVPMFPPPPMRPVPAMPPFYRGHGFRYPITVPDWNIAARMRLQHPFYRYPFQHMHPPFIRPRMWPPIIRCPPGYGYPPPRPPPILPPPVIIDEVPNVPEVYQDLSPPAEQIVPNEIVEPYVSEFDAVDDPPFYEAVNSLVEPPPPPVYDLDYYLSLPRELFPNATMLAMDPNPIIDGFCRFNGVVDHASWIMDLEFGVPREATSRPIAVYDVKNNSIHCKHAPNAIHPGFESCHPEFKRVLTFYYDCILSTWYRGYVAMNRDRSVENFQSWLCLPMQEIGMCWP